MTRKRTTAIAIAALVLSGGCSFLVEFPKDGRPCTENDECIAGYSCRVNECIKDRSVEEAGSCLQDIQCQEDLVCVKEGPREPINNRDARITFTCRKECSNIYFSTPTFTPCASNEACVSVLNTSNEPTGVCAPSQCTTNSECADNKCLEARLNVGICATTCTKAMGCEAGSICHPAEEGVTPILICIPGIPGAGTEGTLCNLSDARCAQDLGCPQEENATCLPICDNSTDCTTNNCVNSVCRP